MDKVQAVSIESGMLSQVLCSCLSCELEVLECLAALVLHPIWSEKAWMARTRPNALPFL